MRHSNMVEKALAANDKTQSRGNILKNYPPCQHFEKIGYQPSRCCKRINLKYYQHVMICKSMFENDKEDAYIIDKEK